MTLTDEQRRLVEDSAWIVNTVLQRQELNHDEDLRQEAYLHLCRCATRFDATRGIKWDTYAYTSLFLHIKKINGRYWRGEKREDVVRNNAAKIAEFPYDDCFAKIELSQILDECTDEERAILACVYMEKPYRDIAATIGCSVKEAGIKWKELKQKITNGGIRQ